MSTLDEITKEKQRIGEALARVDAQRDKLTSQLSELEATERVLTRYTKGTRAKKWPQRRRQRQRGHAGAGVAENQAAACATHRPWGIRSSPLQPAKRSRKSPLHVRALAQTTSASSLPDTNGLAASKNEMGGSTPHRQRGRRNLARSDTEDKIAPADPNRKRLAGLSAARCSFDRAANL